MERVPGQAMDSHGRIIELPGAMSGVAGPNPHPCHTGAGRNPALEFNLQRLNSRFNRVHLSR